MQQNIGGLERQVYLLIGGILVLIGLFAPLAAIWQTTLLLIAAIVFMSSIAGFRPLLEVLGISLPRKSVLRQQDGKA